MKYVTNSNGRGIVGTLDAHYYLGQGAVFGVEREFVVMEAENDQRGEAHQGDAGAQDKQGFAQERFDPADQATEA